VRRVLVIRPEYDDATRIASTWANAIVPRPGCQELRGADATRSGFEQSVRDHDPRLLLFYGHANDDYLAGHNGESVLDTSNLGLLRGRIAVAFACWSGNILGEMAIDPRYGALAFVGYISMVFLPSGLGADAVMSDAATYLANALLSGNTCNAAVAYAQDIYTLGYQRIVRENSGHVDERPIASRLIRARNSLKIHGNRWAVVDDT
jgi:hypothetical protein